MSIVFFGTPSFAVPTLKALLSSGEKVSLVITQPDKTQGRGKKVIFSPVKEIALSEGLQVLQPERLRDKGLMRLLSTYSPDFIVTVAYGKILPKEMLEIAKYGAINVHASLLPLYRGSAPIQWALINGDNVTGITTMMMDAGLDTGDILLREETSISDNDNAETLTTRLSSIGAELLINTIKGIKENSIIPVPQGDGATYAPPIKREDGIINWQKSARDIFNLVRGLFMWPNAYSYLKGQMIKFYKVKALKGSGTAGRIEDIVKGNLIVGTGEGLLEIEELQAEGKKRMSCRDFLSGRRVSVKDDYFS
ncbi:MAG TPA: methionyl-tRNA formyltransferase [Nitrospirae bacterium]|nr:methionyl-tRNA formyltransferase [Nitrospirota bacterium]